jgi:hypothetical protein
MNSRCGSETRTRSLGDAAIVSCVDGGVLIYRAVVRRRWLEMFARGFALLFPSCCQQLAGALTILSIPDAKSAIHAGR